MRWAIAFCALFCAGVVAGFLHARAADAQRAPFVQRPPERFEVRDEAMFCHFLTWPSLYERCGPGNLGCAIPGGRQMWLAHPAYFPDEGWALLTWHEIAHGNRNNNADPQDSNHNAIYMTQSASGAVMGAGLANNGSNVLLSTNGAVRNRTGSDFAPAAGAPNDNSLFGSTRSAAGSFVRRRNGANDTHNFASQTPLNADLFVFTRNVSGPSAVSASRIAFYSIGEHINLEALESRVATLLSDIGAAI